MLLRHGLDQLPGSAADSKIRRDNPYPASWSKGRRAEWISRVSLILTVAFCTQTRHHGHAVGGRGGVRVMGLVVNQSINTGVVGSGFLFDRFNIVKADVVGE